MRFLGLFFAALLCFACAPAHAYQEQSICVDVTFAAAVDDERYIAWPHPGDWEIFSVTWAPATAVAVAPANFVSFTVALNAGTASAVWTTISSTTTNSVGGVPYVIGTVLDLGVNKPSTLGRGFQVRIENTNAGTGAAWDGALCLAARKVR